MPDYLDISRINLLPPIGKFSARNVKRRRRDQMVKDDVVLLAPAEARQMIEIIVVEKFSGERLCTFIERFVNQFRGEKNAERREF